eukprot:3376887-Pleurochrysis_carterae.AAC.1
MLRLPIHTRGFTIASKCSCYAALISESVFAAKRLAACLLFSYFAAAVDRARDGYAGQAAVHAPQGAQTPVFECVRAMLLLGVA